MEVQGDNMEIRIVEEAGHETAIEGLGFSFTPECQLIEGFIEPKKPLYPTATALAKKDGGHNKFLESIVVWFDMRAPMYFWKQFDTYRIGVTKQSKSTMHSIMKRPLTTDDFSDDVLLDTILKLNSYINHKLFNKVIANLPEGYLQTRRVCTSYKVIRHIIKQRQNHKLGEWHEFCNFMKDMLKYPELLGEDIAKY